MIFNLDPDGDFYSIHGKIEEALVSLTEAGADIRVTAQYEENYGDSKFPYWKKKGPAEFIIRGIDPELVLWSDPFEVDSAVQILLDGHSTRVAKYTLVVWEVIWKAPTELSTSQFLFEIGHPNGEYNNTIEEEA